MKYKVLRIRAKISFMAFEKRCTIKELFLKAILKTYLDLMESGELEPTLSNLKCDRAY
jgi:hypothetical protein